MEFNEKNMVHVFKALGDENRIRILKLLRSGEKCACKLLDEMNISQPTLSHHMKILCDAGIVNGRKEGKWMHYSICCEGVKNIRVMLEELLTSDIMPALVVNEKVVSMVKVQKTAEVEKLLKG